MCVKRSRRQTTKAKDAQARLKRLAELNVEIKNLIDAVARAGWSGGLGERLKASEDECAALLEHKSTKQTTPDIIPRSYRCVGAS